jgi:N-acetylmuramoyl-L-alanine amidase
MAGASSGRTTNRILAAAIVAAFLFSSPAHAISVHRKKQIALEQYHKALQMREALHGRPEGDRTPDDYDRVIEAFRKVYHLAPTSTRADASALAVGDLLTEQARLTEDEKGFKSAIGQYEFLEREYPGSKYRVEALFSTGQIYRDDLNDNDSAKLTFEDFLKKYPRHRLAEDARAALNDIDEEARLPKDKHKNASARSHDSDVDDVAALVPTVPNKRKKLPLITSVRYWSTPDYTRIAIDVQDEIKYEAGRVPSPDRIFFDLHNAKLASELAGKSYDINDGLLKKVRVAQYKANEARVVLEVNSLAEYSAFLLPNPYRLIIDVYGRKPPAESLTAKSSGPKSSGGKVDKDKQPDDASNSLTGVAETGKRAKIAPAAETADSRSSHVAALDHARTESSSDETDSASSRSHSTQAQTVGDDADLSSSEIAALSEDPQKVKATRRPTSAPVVQNVAPRAESSAVAGGDSNLEAKTAQRETKPSKRASRSMPAPTGHEAAPTAAGDLSLIRALGLKIGRIVVDAGHGGHDTGTIGPNGLMEKDLVLDVALRLGKLLETKLGADVVYTRQDDTFIPLETRTAIANQNQADLFISIHANSSSDQSARGVETYYLNFTSSPEALEVAARENAVSETSIHDLQDLVKKIALKEKIDESREFAVTVEKSLYAGESAKSPGVKNRGVKKAPFIVLIGANMPSILAEISFVSNPTDERKLRTPEYRQRIAESLYRGISHYTQGLSGIKVASAKSVSTGQ